MDQTSNFASSPLLTTVQITAAVALVVGIFVVSTEKSDQAHTRTDTFSVDRATSNGNRDSLVARAHYQTDSGYDSRRTIKQCKFEGESWDAPTTNFSPLGSTPAGLGWGSNVDNNGMGVTAPLSIQPSPRVAQLPDDFPQYISTDDKELGGWGSLTTEEVEMIKQQRESDVGLKSIEEIENEFPADEFDSSVWQDPVPQDAGSEVEPSTEEPSVEAISIKEIENEFPAGEFDSSVWQDPVPQDTGSEIEPSIEEPAIEAIVVEDGSPEESLDTTELDGVNAEELAEISIFDGRSDEEGQADEFQADEFLVDKLLETGTPLSDSVLQESTSESADEKEFEDHFIPMQDLPKDEPERTPEQKERDDLKLAPLPKFKKSNDFLGEFDEPVVAIKDLPGLKGKKKKRKLPKLNKTDPTWWAAQIHQPQLAGRQQLETTLDEVIFMALRAAPQIQVLNTRPQIQRAVLNEANADFDWSAFVNSTWNDINDPIGSTLTAGGTANQFIQREWVFESGLRKRLRSGGDFTIGQNFGTLDSNSTFLNPDNQGNSRLVLDYRQPLLRGAGPSFNTSQIALADLDLQSISSESLAELQGYLVEVVSAYWNIYFQRAALVQNRQAVRLAEELLRQLESRKGIDVRNDQLLRAEAAVGSRRSAMIRSEYDLINAQDTLINLVMGAKSETVDQIELLPEPMILPMGYRVESEQLVQAAIRNRPEVRASIAQIRSSAIRKQIAANQLLPQLDAVLSSYISGLRGDRDIGGSFSDQFSTGEPSYTFGVQFEIPLGNRAAKSRLQRSQYEAQVFHREFERQVGDVVLEARIAGREIERLNRENENNFAALQKAAQELDLIQQRQLLSLDDSRTGSLYIEDLLASQGRLTAAESRLAQSQTSLAVALIDLKRATGELLSSGENAHQVLYEAVPFEGVPLDGVPIEGMVLEGVPMESFPIEEVIIEPAAPIDFQFGNQQNNFGFPVQ